MGAIRPRAIFISHNEDTEKLYELEAQRQNLIREIAEEWKRVQKKVNNIDVDIWKEAIPQALYDMLGSYGSGVAKPVCKAWLEDNPAPALKPPEG